MQTIKDSSTEGGVFFIRLTPLLPFLLLFFFAHEVRAQTFQDTTLKLISIQGDSLKGVNLPDKRYQRVIGHVLITHEGTSMTCDSAHFYLEENRVEAFSQVEIWRSNGARASGDYIRYTGFSQIAYIQGNVRLMDGPNTLYTESLTYNLKTKLGRYDQGGTLQTEETTVSSDIGTYNTQSKQAYFKGEVMITNPRYTIESDELNYHTETKVIRFLARSIIYGENSTIHTLGGLYDSPREVADFTKRTTVENEEQVISGNALHYNEKKGDGFAKGDVELIDVKNDTRLTADQSNFNRETGEGEANGHVRIEQEGGRRILTALHTRFNRKSGYGLSTGQVVMIDTTEHTVLMADTVEFNDHTRFFLATGKPKLISKLDQDSLYLRADTLFSFRVRDKDSLKRTWIPLSEGKKVHQRWSYNLLLADSTWRSENKDEPRILVANHRVRIFSDSMQAVCDSLSYAQTDSVFRLFRAPVLWNRNSQASGDSIYLYTRNQKLESVQLRNTALLITDAGFPGLYDQVAGIFMDARFEDQQLQEVWVNQNAETAYYAKDDAGAFIGLNRAESAQMRVYFKEKKLDHLVMYQEPQGTFYPIDQLTDQEKKLDRFILYTERKPKSKEEILNDD